MFLLRVDEGLAGQSDERYLQTIRSLQTFVAFLPVTVVDLTQYEQDCSMTLKKQVSYMLI